jgi:hypothetical protein
MTHKPITVVDLTTAKKLISIEEGQLIDRKFEGNQFYNKLKDYKLYATKTTPIKTINTEYTDDGGCKVTINEHLSSRTVLTGRTGSKTDSIKTDIKVGKPYTVDEREGAEDANIHNILVKDELIKMREAIDEMILANENLITSLENRIKEITDNPRNQNKEIIIIG